MAEVKGKMLTCDRCGKQYFKKYIETKETDGGFTRVDTYEDAPDGWYSRDVSELRACKCVLLCPECNKEFTDFIHTFMDAKVCCMKAIIRR